ncbi:hypothetical protein AB0I72_19265 [Nocardiopsis sp. NPDC049922]|uniref:hypothetical protein n=1 Tax=Nocardiopsis sp. NPDC049922 TaxID=3155157 RepID=UPI0033DFCC05
MTEPTVTLFSFGLLSKWGFGDGDTPDEWLDYLDEHGIDWDDAQWPLAALVRRYLLPELAKHHTIEVYEIETIHNPIRASRVDGIEIDPLAADDEVELIPASVDVPLSEALRIAQLAPKETSS